MPKWQVLFYNIAMNLKELRKETGLTQPEASMLLGVPFRTYCRYEDDDKYVDTFKYKQMVSLLEKRREESVLKIDFIKQVVADVCSHYKVEVVYLFGSYAKGKATGKSDIDLMVTGEVEGLEYYELLGVLEERLHKKVDIVKLETATQNANLIKEILKDGIKIYKQ